MAVFYSNWNNTYRLRLEVDTESQSITNNTTTYVYRLYIETTSKSYNGKVEVGYLNADGSSLWRSPSSANYTNRFHQSILLNSGRRTVAHNNIGDKSVTFRSEYTAHNNGWGPSGLSLTGRVDFPRIARASGITSISATELGKPVTIRLDRKNGIFKHTVSYRYGSSSWIRVGEGLDTTVTFTPPISDAEYITNGDTGTLQVSVQTTNGNNAVGSSVQSTTSIKVPYELMPTFGQIVHFEANEAVEGLELNSYLQGLSTPIVSIQNSSGIYGSTIKSYKIEVDEQILNLQTGQMQPIKNIGVLKVKGTITDTRNRSVSQTVEMRVQKYHPPMITTDSLYRVSDGSSKEDPLGSKVFIYTSGGASPVYKDYDKQDCKWGVDYGCQLNSGSLEVRYRVKGTREWKLFDGRSTVGGMMDATLAGSTGSMPITFSRDNAYEFQITMTDMFSERTGVIATEIHPVGVGKSAMQVLDDSVAIGMLTNEVKRNLYVAERGIKTFGPVVDKNEIEFIALGGTIVEYDE